jgi:hypothetical protein
MRATRAPVELPYRMPPSGSAPDDGIASSARLGRHRWASDATDDGPDAVGMRPTANESPVSGEARLPVITDTDRVADGIVPTQGAAMVVPSQRSDPMAEHGPTIGREATGDGWGLVVFAGVMMILLGIFHALTGLTAILKDQFFVFTSNNYLISVDVTAWGWIHLIGGVVVALAGFYVFSGAAWARGIGILLAALSAIANFLFIPYYPLWSLLMIALDIFVIWALARHGREVAA